MTPDDAELLSMEAWLALPERTRNAIVVAYAGTAPPVVEGRSLKECQRGHEFTVENTIWVGEKRECRACRNERKAAARKRAKGK